MLRQLRPTLFFVGVLFFSANSILAQDEFTLSNGTVCGMEGDAQRPDGKALNRLKNRYVAPTESDIDADVTLEAMLTPGDDVDRFDVNRAAKLYAYVIDVKPGGKETCNCHATAQVDKDTHIELAVTTTAEKIQRVTIEVSPRWRAIKDGDGVDWTTAALRDPTTGIEGKWVEVTGWLFFDTMHIHEAENTNPGESRNWRATCWELHPVTDIVISNAPPVDNAIAMGLVTQMQRAYRNEARRNPGRLESIRQRNALVLSRFDAGEMDEPPEGEEGIPVPNLAPRHEEIAPAITLAVPGLPPAMHPSTVERETIPLARYREYVPQECCCPRPRVRLFRTRRW